MAVRYCTTTLLLVLLSISCHAQLYETEQQGLQTLIAAFPALKTLPQGAWTAGQEAAACTIPWAGLTCANTQSISHILVAGFGLVGSVPGGMWGNFSSLVEVDFSHNKVIGALPADLLGHSNIERISFVNCSLNQAIPNVTVGGRLSSLLLQQNEIVGGLPSEMMRYSLLSTLDVTSNRMSGLLPSRFHTSFRVIRLGNNQFTGEIPEDVYSTYFFTEFTANDNLLTGQLRSLTSTTSLLKFNVANNVGLTGCFFTPITLTTCDLYNTTGCYCDGTTVLNNRCRMPGCVGAEDRAALTEIARAMPELTTLPTGAWSTNDADAVYACVNHWQGAECASSNSQSVPPRLGEYIARITLSKHSPPYVPLPSVIASMPRLSYLNLSGKYFNGTMPAAYNSFAYPLFSYLTIDGTSVTGELPAFVPRTWRPVEANIRNNPGITGSPSGKFLANYADFSGNSLTGGLTQSDLEFYYGMILDNNNISSIPDNFTNTQINSLSLRNNQISSASLSDLFFSTVNRSSLSYLDLSGNQLQSDILRKFASIAPGVGGTISTLKLADCGLSGPISSELSALSSFGALDLSRNQLNGPLPVFLLGINNANLSRNQFLGPLPTPLNFVNLDLSHNLLSGCFEVSSGGNCNFEGNQALCGCYSAACNVPACWTNKTISTIRQFIAAIPGLASLPRPWVLSPSAESLDIGQLCSNPWTGISCSGSKITLNLSGLGLTGTLATNFIFADLPFDSVVLDGNNIKGCIASLQWRNFDTCSANSTSLCACNYDVCGLSVCAPVAAPVAPPAVPAGSQPSQNAVNSAHGIQASLTLLVAALWMSCVFALLL